VAYWTTLAVATVVSTQVVLRRIVNSFTTIISLRFVLQAAWVAWATVVSWAMPSAASAALAAVSGRRSLICAADATPVAKLADALWVQLVAWAIASAARASRSIVVRAEFPSLELLRRNLLNRLRRQLPLQLHQ